MKQYVAHLLEASQRCSLLQVSQTNPYDIQQSSELEAEQKLRYGGMPRDEPSSSNDQKVSKPDEGPSGSSRGGRKPEGRA